MTRINVGIPPARLPDKLLLAEHREIKRLPNHLRKFGKPLNPPNKFTLGAGHVKFLITKGAYTYQRYVEIFWECINRGFKVANYRGVWGVYLDYPELYGRYTPTRGDIKLIKQRIKERGYDLR